MVVPREKGLANETSVPSAVAITGCAGFIGSKTSQLLLEQGLSVVGIDCLSADLYSAKPKQESLAALQRYPNFTFYEVDLRSDALTDAIAPADVVIHFAAMAGLSPSWANPDLYVANNVDATQRLVAAAIRAGTKHLVHASTSSVYGSHAVGNEEIPLRPTSPYGATKLAAEEIVRDGEKSGGLSATILRYFSVYGPGQRPDMAFAKAITAITGGQKMVVTGDGSQSRSNTFIHDAAMAAVLAAQLQPSATLNICGGESVSLLKAIRHIEKITSRTANLSYVPHARGDQRTTRGDSSRATRVLGWRPTTALFEGLVKQVDAVVTRPVGLLS